MLKWLLIALYCMYAGRKVRIVKNCDPDHNKMKMLRSHFSLQGPTLSRQSNSDTRQTKTY